MEAVFGGVLLGLTIGLGGIYAMLLVRPEWLFAWWQDASVEGWFEEQHPASLRALRWLTGTLLLVLGFLTGLAWTFQITVSAR